MDRTFEIIQQLADPSPFDLGNAAERRRRPVRPWFYRIPCQRCGRWPRRSRRRQGGGASDFYCPGHGTRIEDMQRASGEDWVAAVEREYEDFHAGMQSGVSGRAVARCSTLLPSGACADRRIRSLRGMILMAPAFGVTTCTNARHSSGRTVHNLRNKGRRASDYFLDHDLYSYLQIPLNLAAELIQLGREAAQNMGKLRDLPVMMFVGDRESTVSLEKILSVARKNPWIRLVRLPRSRHILTVEPDKEMMFEASIRFMEECLGKRL